MFGNETITKVLLLTLLVSVGSGCNKPSFGAIDPVEKSKLLSDQYVFENPNGSDSGYPRSGFQLINPNGQDSGYGQNSPNSQDPGGRQPSSVAPPVVTLPGTVPPISPAPGSSIPPTQPPGTVSLPPSSIPPSTPPTTATQTPPPEDTTGSTIPPSLFQIPLQFVCSTAETNSKGVNLISSTNLKVQVIQYNGRTEVGRCVEDDPNLAAQIKASKTMSFHKCLPKGKFLNSSGGTVRVPSSTATGDSFSVDFIANSSTSILSGRGNAAVGEVNILFDANALDNLTPPYPLSAANQALCDDHASPLFVDMRSEFERTQRFSLSAPWAGVWFDILGENAAVAHAPNRISWFDSAAMAYVVLPNSRGQVLGIDELFGDNTLGPDGKFASNGYEALAKYDSNGDGVISSEDQIFAKLKIWQDKNHDGKAQASELMSLTDAKLTVIDLHYDSGFSEQDIYGNTIKYKSVAKTAAGGYRLVFDIWFELNLYKASQRFAELSR